MKNQRFPLRIPVAFDEETVELLDKIAAATKETRSNLVRRIVAEGAPKVWKRLRKRKAAHE